MVHVFSEKMMFPAGFSVEQKADILSYQALQSGHLHPHRFVSSRSDSPETTSAAHLALLQRQRDEALIQGADGRQRGWLEGHLDEIEKMFRTTLFLRQFLNSFLRAALLQIGRVVWLSLIIR